MKDVILALDAGGTKTKVAAIDNDKRVVFETISYESSLTGNVSSVISHLFSLLESSIIIVEKEFTITEIIIGLSGYSTISNAMKFEEDFFEKFHIKTTLISDTKLGIYSIIKDQTSEGIMVLAGTGSAVLAIANDKTLLVGGWGHLIEEKGSSYSIVMRVILDAIHNYDSGIECTNLQKVLMKHVGISNPSGFRIYVYKSTKKEIASLAMYISEAAKLGSKEAIDLLKQCGKELAEYVRTVYERLGLSSSVHLGFVGSFVQKAPYVKEVILEELKKHKIYYKEVEAEDPIFGAYYMYKRRKLC